MKKLKKLLALMIVMTMALGMIPFASAAFTDEEQIENAQAAEVLNKLGVLMGYEDGSFGPNRTITRAEAAAVMTRLVIGAEAAKTIESMNTPTTFSDVAPTHWASGLIMYCVAQGIIKGHGDGTFGPEDPVTTVQFTIMLLRVLGWGRNGEFEGDFYLVNAIAKGRELGILSGTADWNAGASRDSMAGYAFTALFIDRVFFSSDTQEYTTVRAPGNTLIGNLAEHVFGLASEYDRDDFGRPARKWMLDEEAIATFAFAPDATWAKGIDDTDILLDLGYITRVSGNHGPRDAFL